VAVLLVLLEHMLVGLWINPVAATGTLHMTAPPDPAAMDQFQIPTALWLIRHDIILGNIGVAFFFLISGFVIPMSLERLSAGRFVVAASSACTRCGSPAWPSPRPRSGSTRSPPADRCPTRPRRG